MRGKKAKRLRKEAYGEFSSDTKERKYGRHEKTGAVNAHLLRQNYQKAKADERGSK